MNTGNEVQVQEMSENIRKWLKEKNGLVVGIDGYSGVGKTTLLRYLVKKDNFIQPVFMDDFVSTVNTKELLLPQIEVNSPKLDLQLAPLDGLKKLRKVIADFKLRELGNKALVVEGIFLFHPNVLNDVWDKRIYLDISKEKADTRRIIREKERWGEKYFPETHPDSFARLFKIAHKRYEELYQPKKHSDLIIQMN